MTEAARKRQETGPQHARDFWAPRNRHISYWHRVLPVIISSNNGHLKHARQSDRAGAGHAGDLQRKLAWLGAIVNGHDLAAVSQLDNIGQYDRRQFYTCS